jgi:hypothetical protein
MLLTIIVAIASFIAGMILKDLILNYAKKLIDKII